MYRSIFRQDLFDGKVVLVTGGGTGIGRCIAHELASLGATVIIAARRIEPLQETSEEIAAAGGKVFTQVLNIREPEAVDAVVVDLVKTHGPIFGLVNNAGGQFASPAALIRPKGWRAVVDTNLNGTWFVSQALFKHSMAKNGGAIVNIVADMWNGFPGMAHTGAARAAVVNLTKTLAVEWGPAGVRVNGVAPGWVLSSGLNNYPKGVQKLAAKSFRNNPSGRPGTEAEMSAAVAFLLSEGAAFISGDTLRVDGAASLAKTGMVELRPHTASKPFDGFHLPAQLPPVFVEEYGEQFSLPSVPEEPK